MCRGASDDGRMARMRIGEQVDTGWVVRRGWVSGWTKVAEGGGDMTGVGGGGGVGRVGCYEDAIL